MNPIFYQRQRRGMIRPEYMTVAEAAARSRHSEESVRRWLRSGRLKGARVAGGRWLVAASDLDAILGLARRDKEGGSHAG